MEIQNIHRLGPLLAATLTPEEFSGLEVAMLQRKLQENLTGKMFFWGKIFGTTQDYLIVYNVNPFDEFPEKKYYFTTSSDYVLKAFPFLSDEYISQASKITSAFTGDSSFYAFNGEVVEEEEDTEGPPKERFREIHRLAYTVMLIDHDCSIVPRGSYIIDATKKVMPNAYFPGLSFNTAIEPRAYLHFRKPESLQSQALLKRPSIIKSGDFMDCIDKDYPAGIWSISHNDSGTQAHLRHLYWEGYGFYTALNSSEYGGAYFGTGVPNYDIAFML